METSIPQAGQLLEQRGMQIGGRLAGYSLTRAADTKEDLHV
jgi:hypothetical protein